MGNGAGGLGAAADVDGHVDIVTAGKSDANLFVLHGYGTYFDEDGRPDIALASGPRRMALTSPLTRPA